MTLKSALDELSKTRIDDRTNKASAMVLAWKFAERAIATDEREAVLSCRFAEASTIEQLA